MVEDDFEEDGLLDGLVVVIFGEAEEEGGDEIIEYFIVELLLCSGGESAIDGHIFNYCKLSIDSMVLFVLKQMKFCVIWKWREIIWWNCDIKVIMFCLYLIFMMNGYLG